jgi:hypothetical protein
MTVVPEADSGVNICMTPRPSTCGGHPQGTSQAFVDSSPALVETSVGVAARDDGHPGGGGGEVVDDHEVGPQEALDEPADAVVGEAPVQCTAEAATRRSRPPPTIWP